MLLISWLLHAACWPGSVLAISSAPHSSPAEVRAPVAFEGTVLDLDGSPAVGAVVVSSAGGRALTDERGAYRLEVEVGRAATSAHVTAVGRGTPSTTASASVALPPAHGVVRVRPLRLAQGSGCVPGWLPAFDESPGANGALLAMVVFDDGRGPALYVGGSFTSIGRTELAHVARWDGERWSALGDGLPSVVESLAVFDDGSGPALFAGGAFSLPGSNGIARWDGTSWQPVGAGGTSSNVRCMTVFDDGGGPALFVGGLFSFAGGLPANHVARWDGTSWSALGGGTDAQVEALTVYDDGSGAALIAGGTFTTAGTANARHVARWDGTRWTRLGGGVGGASLDFVFALTVFDDGSGPELVAGGTFVTAAGSTAQHIASWNGTRWAALGSGIGGTVRALAVSDVDGSPRLLAGGSFSTAGGAPANGVARWDGTSWSALGSGVSGQEGSSGTVSCFAVLDAGQGPALYVGGGFREVSGRRALNIARWNGERWAGLAAGFDDDVLALTVYDDGSGPALYAGGTFTSAGGVPVRSVARWDGSAWTPLGRGMENDSASTPRVSALAVFDDGSGPALIAGGSFQRAGGVLVHSIAKWNGTQWSPLGNGATIVSSMMAFDDGSGPALYVGNIGVPRRWDGTAWTTIGAGVPMTLLSMVAFDDGGGPALYAGGATAGSMGEPLPGVFRWNGSSWTRLGDELHGIATVDALAAFDDGSGPALFAGGSFTASTRGEPSWIARWNGSAWNPLGSDLDGEVEALRVHDDGSGPALYAGGSFTTAGGVAVNRIARWDGTRWSPLGAGTSDAVHALAVYDAGSGPALHAGGHFRDALDSGDSYLAQWGCDLLAPEITCSGNVVVLDQLGSAPGEVVDFAVEATDNLVPPPKLLCIPPSGSFFPVGTTWVSCTATDVVGNQSTCRFPVTVQRKARRR